MPWHIGKHEDCSGFAVIKGSDGSLAGCHETEAEAEAQMAALYASEGEMEERVEYVTDSTDVQEIKDKSGYPRGDSLIQDEPSTLNIKEVLREAYKRYGLEGV